MKPADSELEEEALVADETGAQAAEPAAAEPVNRLNGANAQAANMMGDAPMCSGCGHITVRNGSCYKCLNCGNSMGCS